MPFLLIYCRGSGNPFGDLKKKGARHVRASYLSQEIAAAQEKCKKHQSRIKSNQTNIVSAGRHMIFITATLGRTLRVLILYLSSPWCSRLECLLEISSFCKYLRMPISDSLLIMWLGKHRPAHSVLAQHWVRGGYSIWPASSGITRSSASSG